MRKRIYTGRNIPNEDGVVVFLIGMRVNKWRAVHKWLPVFKAMPPMIKELYTTKDLGFLSMETFAGIRTTLMVQYWRSSEQLISYAHNEKHLNAWKNFNDKMRNNNAVGIYHETYLVPEGNCEGIYRNMPLFGLGQALGQKPVTNDMQSSRQRLKKAGNTAAP
ncbi:DUF4188 domain-containing protein [Halobacillus salinarum]|uniref:DUF4188 domain-containing protein n=1 Tax=Halobacillus salinarum TaxID=2932257 RepID=A0ABY4EES3_9BACI|nr:DUF4188 domain-containing protein [Halobacillus salinarum]UOQ42969.1 DUF4188 domain-containing protein [Halobacillus salinarum]